CPLKPKDLYEIFRDDLEFHEISWNILGLVVADKTNYLHMLKPETTRSSCSSIIIKNVNVNLINS
ncbi:24611_t:CDS:2, partial [Entrophospora sp. SA101]